MPISPENRKQLLAQARAAIQCRLHGEKPSDLPEPGGALSERAGAFVSLHARNGDLRGCIGTFTSDDPLPRTVREMAVSAAFHDPRFPPLVAGDLDDLEIEISVLSPLVEIRDPSEIVVGKHGLYVTSGAHRGVLLPQVAAQHGWDRQTFVEQTCRKAGLPRGRWKDPETKMRVFTAEVFGEKEEKSGKSGKG